MYEGFLRLGGTELVNANRTEAYVANLLPGFPLKGCQGVTSMPRALGETYDSPILDGAPWIDPQNPATYRFYGLYPISIEGMDSSTVTASVTESLSDGGYVHSPRASSREIRVRGVLIGEDELAVTAGMSWLNEALSQANCDGDRDCNGGDLDFFAAEPEFEVCYDSGVGGGDGYSLDGLEPGNVLQIARNTLNQDARIIGRITPIAGWDGLTFSWGVSRVVGTVNNNLADPLFNYGPVTPFRTNRIRNPRFAVDTALWGSNAALARVATGGPDGGTFGRMSLVAGTSVMQIDTVDALSSQNMLQFWARTDQPMFDVIIRSTVDFSVLHSETFTGDSDWNEYSTVVPTGSQTYVEFSVTTAGAGTFDVTKVLMEAATQLFPYFDGDTPPEMVPSGYPDALSPEYATSWLGAPHVSASRMEWVGGPLRYELCGLGLYPWISVSSGFGSVGIEYGFEYPVTDEEQLTKFTRYMRDVSRVDGPRVTRVFNTGVGVGRVVEFLLTAGTPFAYTRMPGPHSWNLAFRDGLSFTDTPEPPAPPVVIVDPDCPPAPTPPRPPIIENSCVLTPGTWDRYTLYVEADEISRWSTTLPDFHILTTDELRQARVRAYQNPLGVDAFRINRARRPYPDLASPGGWLTADIGKYTVTQTATGARRVGTATSRQARTTSALDSVIAHWTSVGSDVDAPTAAQMIDTTTIGIPVSLSVYYRVVNSPNPRYSFIVEWFNGAGASFGTSTQTPQATIGDSSAWHRAAFTVDPPAGANRMKISVMFYTASGTLATGTEVTFMQDLQVENHSTPTPYFDGNGYRPVVSGTDPGAGNQTYAWAATALASASTARIDRFGFESEFIISYMPAGSELSVDSTVRRSEIILPTSIPGQWSDPISAANLIYGRDGGPMTWPEFRCGVPYILTVDLPTGADPNVQVGMGLTRRE